TDEEIQKGMEFVRSQIAFYGSTPAYRGVLELHGWHDLHPQLHKLSKEKKWKEMADLLTDDVVAAFAITGTPEQVTEKLVSHYSGRVDRTSFPFRNLDPDRTKALVKILKAA